MGNIEISSLQSEQLIQKAKLADKNGNGKIDTDELSVFQNYVKTGEMQDADMQEYNKIFGSEIKSPVSTPITLTKKQVKDHNERVKDSVKEMVKSGIEPKDLMAKLNKEYKNPEYRQMLDEVAYTLRLVDGTNYNSKDDVESIHKKVKAQLKGAGKWDDFHKDLLDSLEDQAKNAQIGKEFKALVNEYESVKATMQKTDVVKNNGDNFKAYVEIVKDNLKKNKNWKESYTKEAFEQLENYAKKDAKRLVQSRLANETQATTKKGIRKELRGMNRGGDDYQKDAIHDLKTDRRIFARKHKVENKANALSSITADALRTELGKRGYQYNFAKKASAHKIGNEIYEKLNKSYLTTVRNDDGTYDLSKLSEEIASRVGQDYKVNLSKDDKMAELKNIQNHLKSITGQDFTDNETKVLVNMLGFEREHKDHTPKILKTATGAIGGGIAALSASSKLNVHQEVALTVNADIAKDIIDQLEQSGVTPGVTELGNGEIGVTVLQEYMRDNTITDILKGAGIGALTNALLDIVVGDGKDEKSCMSISDYDINDPTYTDSEKYKEYVSNVFKKNPEKVEALHTMVDLYKEKYGDQWHAQFQQALRKIAGFGSKLNPEECRMVKYNKPNDGAPVKPGKEKSPVTPDGTVQPPQQDTVPPTNPENNPEVPEVKENCQVEYKEDIKMTDSAKFEWKNIVKMYYGNCLKTHSISEITTKIKKYNNIPMSLNYIPAGIVLPYDLFGDGECTRTERQDVKQGKVAQAKKTKKFNGQLGDAGVQARNVCQNRDGSYTATEWTKRHKDRAGAEQEARENGWIK